MSGYDDDVEFAPELPIVRHFEALSAAETMAIPELNEGERLLGSYVTAGGRTVIAGSTGHGKTTLAYAMARAILAGEEFAGETGAGIGPLLIVDLEQGLRSIKRALREAGLADRTDVFVVRVPDGLALESDEIDRAELERVVAEVQPALVILDPFYKAHRADSNEERAVTDLMRSLDALRARHGFALVLPAHVRKAEHSNGVRKLTLDDVAGSGAATRGAEVVLAIERIAHGVARLRFLKDRDGELRVGEALELTYTKEAGFRVKEHEDVEAKARELGADGAWRTLKEWAKALGVGEKRTRTLLDGLVEAGLFEYEQGPEGRQAHARCWRQVCVSPPDAPDADLVPGTKIGNSASVRRGFYRTPAPDAESGRSPNCADAPDAPGAEQCTSVDVDEIERLAEVARALLDDPPQPRPSETVG